ncbi:TrkH family potassium uptake protein [Pseudooctadecabacter jejudonensis]|uniref:Ktr system potassium uptake protein B n=1 Tax=Pseudooctadecabacter jejudonensis TaxID=1391910 RepID=A0A1Y5SWI8_9RHOB|nr:potassium transporter TrkG [Pseudooctadecabacter jejudonensis]SLN49422.1 Ktr system potassium uptake protein B [Pseudooctadecabacter jejudonensis]
MTKDRSKSYQSVRTLARLNMFFTTTHPAKLLLFGYLSYILIGWVLLSLPVLQEVSVGALDTLFIATSAVSTTGLVSVDPASSFTFGGELVILFLIQLGGLGYMTIGSFMVLTIQHRLGHARRRTTKAAFNLPDDIDPRSFIMSVLLFTFLVEAVGATILYFIFAANDVANPLWPAIFHAISAFCTAGFSLFPNSLEDYAGDLPLNVTISVLSLLGAMGFLIVVDSWRTFVGRKKYLGFTTKVIVRITGFMLVAGTLIFFVVEPSIADVPPAERLMLAFFQTMTAATTVGFNTHPIGSLAPAILMVMFFLMMIGASPAGTGGGLKTTSLAALIGLVRSTLKGRDQIRFFKRRVPLDKLQNAAAGLTFYMALLAGSMFVLLLTEAAAFEVLMFEAISAMGTVGLSMGITGDLSDLGKLVIIVLMTAGRVGILTFGIALATADESRAEEEDNSLVL